MYCTFKKEFKYEPYLNQIHKKEIRSNLTKLRISAHKLRIETGRYAKPNKILEEDRISLFCDLNKIEDEHHFMLECTLYNHLREEMMQKIIRLIPQFPLWPNVCQFLTLMNPKIYKMSEIISTYIYHAFMFRNSVNV